MVSAKELIKKFDLRVINCERTVMMIVIFAIEEVTQEARRRETAVVGRTIIAVKSEMHNMDRKVRR